MSPQDVALSKGIVPKPFDPTRLIRDPRTKAVVGYWVGAVIPQPTR